MTVAVGDVLPAERVALLVVGEVVGVIDKVRQSSTWTWEAL